ncbi:MAG: hypothetical protein AAFZ15_09430 [Bacteroidota bacterium]
MTSNNPSNPNQPKVTPTYSSNQKKDNKQNIIAIAATVGVILLGVIGWLAYSNITKANQLEQTVFELQESSDLRSELEVQYNQALSDLESQKTNNEELNAIIDQQKSELEAQKKRISGLLASKGKLNKARAEIENLKTQVSGYMAQIDELKAANDLLAGENASLTEEKNMLTSDLNSKVAENEMLSEAKAQLVNEKAKLSDKVAIASVIKMKNVKVEGMKERSNGKNKVVNKANAVDKIKVCFTTLDNDVVASGTERFFIRLINPLGETLAIEDMGSGVITNKATGEEIRFTQYEEVDYMNEEANSCLYWQPLNLAFMAGTYTVEIYNKGYLAGMGSFSLK